MGAFVDKISGNQVALDDMSGTLQTHITDVQTYSKSVQAALVTDITALRNIVNAYNPTVDDIDTSVDPIDPPPLPPTLSLGDLGLDNYPDDFPTPSQLTEYGDLDFTFVAPTAPAEIDGSFNWSPDSYTSTMWSALFNKVHTDIIDGGTGLTDAVHSAIVSREQEARRNNQSTAYRNGLDAVGATGFNLPSGHVAAFQSGVVSEMLNKDQDSLNNLLIKDFDLATANTQFAVTTGSNLESMLRATFEAAESRGLEAQRATKEYLISTFSENVKLYMAKWEGIKNRLEALKVKIDGIARMNDGIVKVFLGQASVYETQVKAVAAKNKGLIDDRDGLIAIYTAEIDAVTKQYALLVEEARIKMEGTRLEIMSAIEEAKLKLSAYTSEAELAERVSEAIASITAQVVASALGAINATLSNSYSGTESRGETYGRTNTLQEGHSYSHDG